MKVCTRCKIEKEDDDFRLRYEKRGKGSKCKSYLNNICRQCELDISNENYFAHKHDEGFLDDWRKKSREYYQKHRDEIKQKQRIKRQTPEYKAYVKSYREERKELLKLQQSLRGKRYIEKNKNSVSDEYCIQKLKEQKKISREEITPEMIEVKRIQILIKRLRNKIAKVKHEKYNNTSESSI